MGVPRIYAGVFFSSNEPDYKLEDNNITRNVEHHLLEHNDDTKKFSIQEQFFVIPFKDAVFILYFPAIGASFLVNNEARLLFNNIANKNRIELNKETLSVLNYFILNDIISHAQPKNDDQMFDNLLKKSIEKSINEYAPTHAILCPTTDCNQRCIYCYASSGKNPRYMDFSTAKIAVDYIFANAITRQKHRVSLRFHGDGERAKKVYQGLTPLSPDDIADAVVWCADRPPHVNISQMIVMPTDQASAGLAHRR